MESFRFTEKCTYRRKRLNSSSSVISMQHWYTDMIHCCIKHAWIIVEVAGGIQILYN